MHLNWVAAGLEPERFWQITPSEVDREMRGTRKRIEREADERMSLAWHIVALDRTKKLPKLETLLIGGKPGNRRRQSSDEHLVAMKSIFLAFGGNPEELRTLQ